MNLQWFNRTCGSDAEPGNADCSELNLGSRAALAERVRLRAQTIRAVLFESAWSDIDPLERDELLRALDVLTRLQDRDQARLKEIPQ